MRNEIAKYPWLILKHDLKPLRSTLDFHGTTFFKTFEPFLGENWENVKLFNVIRSTGCA